MTREEAIEILKQRECCRECVVDIGDCNDCDKAFEMAFKALEQEPVLDKIRAEIEQNAYPIVHGVNNHERGMTLNGILQIIDKYKAEMRGGEE